MRDEAEKVTSTESRDDQHDLFVGYMVHYEVKVTEKPEMKRIQAPL